MRRWLAVLAGLLAAGIAAWAIGTLRDASSPQHPEHDPASRQQLVDVLREPEP